MGVRLALQAAALPPRPSACCPLPAALEFWIPGLRASMVPEYGAFKVERGSHRGQLYRESQMV